MIKRTLLLLLCTTSLLLAAGCNKVDQAPSKQTNAPVENLGNAKSDEAKAEDNKAELEQAALESAKGKTFPSNSGQFYAESCSLIHKEGNVYVGQFCDGSGNRCVPIELVTDGSSLQWRMTM